MEGIKSSREEMRLQELFSALKPTHALGIIVSILSIVLVAFYLGWTIHALTSDISDRLAADTAQHNFFSHYNRYITARDRYYESGSLEDARVFKITERVFVELVYQWWKNRDNLGTTVELQSGRIPKAIGPTPSRIVFVDDSEFVVPPEIVVKVIASGFPDRNEH